MQHFCPLEKDKLCDHTFITQLTKRYSWKAPGDPDLSGRGFLSISQFCCINTLPVIYVFYGCLIIIAGNAVRFLFDFCTQKSIGRSKGRQGRKPPLPGSKFFHFYAFFGKKFCKIKRLAHPLWELVPQENPGSATEKFFFRVTIVQCVIEIDATPRVASKINYGATCLV